MKKKRKTKNIKLKAYKQAVKESFTTMSGMPQSSQGYATALSSRTASHSISTMSPGDGTGLRSSIRGHTGYNINDINKIEKLTSKAPPLLPFPLDNIFHDLIHSIRYIENVEKQLKEAITNNVSLSPTKLAKLMKMKRTISICLNRIINGGKHIEDINLDEV